MFKKKRRMTKKQMEALPYFVFVAIGLLIILALVIDLTSEPYTGPNFYEKSVMIMKSFSLMELFKLGLIMTFPFVMIAWIVHGVQLRVFA